MKSLSAFEEAKKIIPGEVNSPVRSFSSVGRIPRFIDKGKGCRIYDIDGKEYPDYVLSWVPMILGHAHPQVVSALHAALDKGTSFGAPTVIETELAKQIQMAMPSMELIRMVNSGTEATMNALRLARAYTKRSHIVKFVGCYHGQHDSLLVKTGSGLMTFGVPGSPGVPDTIARTTLTVPYNYAQALRQLFSEYGEAIAAVIIEPVAGNMGFVLPKEGYLSEVKKITEEYGALLNFDEVMTGFRVALAGAQEIFNIKPNLTCLSKVIGGGLPVGAYGGRRDIMENIAPVGPVYQAGTLSGNPLAMAACSATIKLLSEIPGLYQHISQLSDRLAVGLKNEAAKLGIAVQAYAIGGMYGIFFTDKSVYDYDSARASNANAFKIYFHAMVEQGIYLSSSQFEACFMSSAHTDEDIDATIVASKNAFRKVVEG